MATQGSIITPHGVIKTGTTLVFPLPFTLKLTADTAKTLVDTDFGAITTSTTPYAVVINKISSKKIAEIKMHQTATADTITTAELAIRFGPLMTARAADRLYPISVPFFHDNTGGTHLTFIADKDCTIIGRVLALT